MWEKIVAKTPDFLEVPKTSAQAAQTLKDLDGWLASFPAELQQGKGEEAQNRAYIRKHLVRKFVLSIERRNPGVMADVTWEQLRCANPDSNMYTASISPSATWGELEAFWGLNPLMLECWTCFLGAVPSTIRKCLLVLDSRFPEVAGRRKTQLGFWPPPDDIDRALRSIA